MGFQTAPGIRAISRRPSLLLVRRCGRGPARAPGRASRPPPRGRPPGERKGAGRPARTRPRYGSLGGPHLVVVDERLDAHHVAGAAERGALAFGDAQVKLAQAVRVVGVAADDL